MQIEIETMHKQNHNMRDIVMPLVLSFQLKQKHDK